jgi:hypothetical protein
VLDRVVQELAQAAADRARRAPDPAKSLKAGCGAWLESTLDPAVQRIVLLDGASVVGWARAREIDDRHTLSGMRRNLEHLSRHTTVSTSTSTCSRTWSSPRSTRPRCSSSALTTRTPPSAVGRLAVEALIDRLTA